MARTIRAAVHAAAGAGMAASGAVRQHLTRGLAVFVFHDVGDRSTEPELAVSPALFRRQLEWIAASFEVVHPDRLASPGELPSHSAMVTFDDGFRGVAEHALPLLADLGICATLFLNMGVVDRQVPMSDDVAATRLDRTEVERLGRDRAVRLGHHLWRHAYGPALDCAAFDEALRRDIAATSDLDGVLPWLAFTYGAATPRLEHHAQRLGMARLFTGAGVVNADPSRPVLHRIDMSPHVRDERTFLGTLVSRRLVPRRVRDQHSCVHLGSEHAA